MFAEVLVPPLASPFTYQVPDALKSTITVGMRVSVSFGKTFRYGYVLTLSTTLAVELSPDRVKPISAITHPYPHLLPDQVPFLRRVAEYYGGTLSEVVDDIIPPAVPDKKVREVALATPPATAKVKLGVLAKKIIELLTQAPNQRLPLAEISIYYRGASESVKRLEKHGLVHTYDIEFRPDILVREAPAWAKRTVALTDQQQRAVAKINSYISTNQFRGVLLHGATGSGKTEVYLSAIEHALSCGKGALVLVPEISLTPQLVGRMRARLGTKLAVLHSALAPRERWESWRACIEGHVKVAVGARSALFAPIRDLGIIIVDEEHDHSFKQERGIRYHGRDMALARAHGAQCPCVLGSATPSLETYSAATSGKYDYIELPVAHTSTKRCEVELVDLNQVKPWEMPATTISPRLRDEIAKNLQSGDQVFILYNKRGFASYLQCEACEQTLQCPHCSVSLTFHQRRNDLLCHYCGYTTTPPSICPACATTPRDQPALLMHRGAGTERVADDLKRLFPKARLDRLDRDSVKDIRSYEEKLERVRDGTTQILVGTQMIAKGHDMPNVTLVGIVDADVGLHLPDFRAAERTYQLLTQSVGRAGRAQKAGRAIIQTRLAKHPSMTATQQHSYTAFSTYELATRQGLGYPPFSRLIRIVASGEDQRMTQLVLQQIADALKEKLRYSSQECQLLGVAPAPLEKIKDNFRFHLLVKGISVSVTNHVMAILKDLKIKTGKVSVVFDRDPVDML